MFDANKMELFLNNLIELDGIGETQINSIKVFFSDKKNNLIIKNLIKHLNITKYNVKNKSGKFSNKKLMFTGGFRNMSRSEAKSLAENNGGKVLGAISKKLDFLVVGGTKPTKRKLDQAKKLNIKIIHEDEWNKILNS